MSANATLLYAAYGLALAATAGAASKLLGYVCGQFRRGYDG